MIPALSVCVHSISTDYYNNTHINSIIVRGEKYNICLKNVLVSIIIKNGYYTVYVSYWEIMNTFSQEKILKGTPYVAHKCAKHNTKTNLLIAFSEEDWIHL